VARCGAARGAVLLLFLALFPSCSEIARPNDTEPPPVPPSYVSSAANYFQSAFTDRAAYDDFEIAPPRWVHSLKGWSWLACVRFLDHGHLRNYALFIQNSVVIDGRYAVETDACGTQTFTQFDVVTGTLGRPTAPKQPALY